MKKTLIIEIICFLFFFLFSYAALAKLIDYKIFVFQISQSELLNGFENTLAWLVPTAELVVAGMLISPRLRQAGLYASFSLMMMFSAYIVAIQQFTEYIPCSCGGILATMGWTAHLIFNLVFVLLGIAGILLNASNSLTTYANTASEKAADVL